MSYQEAKRQYEQNRGTGTVAGNAEIIPTTPKQSMQYKATKNAALRRAEENSAKQSNTVNFYGQTADDEAENAVSKMSWDEVYPNYKAYLDNLRSTSGYTESKSYVPGSALTYGRDITKSVQDVKGMLKTKEKEDWVSKQEENLEILQNEQAYNAVKEYADWQYTKDHTPASRYKHEKEQDYEAAREVLLDMGYDEDKMESLADTLERAENAEEAAEYREDVEEGVNASVGSQIGYSAASVAANLISGIGLIPGIQAGARQFFTGEYTPVDTNSPWYQPGEFRDITRQNVSQNIEDSVDNKVLKTALPMVYNAGMSTADNLAAAAVGGGGNVGKAVSLGTMSAGAAASGTQEAFERTGDTGKAFLTGAASGLIEYGTEKISLDNLWDIARKSGKAAARNAAVNVLVQSGIEGTEEATSEVANLFVDNLINGGMSDYNLNVQNYMEQGLSEDEAKAQATRDFGAQVLESFAVGSIAGGMGGGAAVARERVGTYAAGSQLRDSGAMESVEQRAEVYDDYNVQKALASYKKHQGGYQAANLYQAVAQYEAQNGISGAQEENVTPSAETVENEAVKSAQEYQSAQEGVQETAGVQEDTPAVAQKTREENAGESWQPEPVDVQRSMEKMAEAQTAETLVEAVREVQRAGTPEQVREAESRYDYLAAKLTSEGKATTEELLYAQNQLSEQQAYEYGRQGQDVDESLLSVKGKYAYNQGKIANMQQRTRESRLTESEAAEIGKAVATSADGKQFEVKRVQSVGEEPVVETGTGTVRVSELSFENIAMQNLYNHAVTQETASAANTYLENYPVGMNINAYDGYFNSFLNAGKLGTSFDRALARNPILPKYISVESLRDIYNAGEEIRQQENRKAGEKENKKKTVIKKGEGKVIDKRLSREEEPFLKLYEKIAEKTGLDIELKDAEMEGINASFNEAMGRVVFNMESEKKFGTVIHEMFGEFSEAWNGKEMEMFRTDLLEWYLDGDGMANGEERINRIIRKYQKTYEQVEGFKGYRAAANEMLNDAMEGLFRTEDGIQDFADWLYDNRGPKEAKTVLQKIADLIKDLCDKIRDYLADSHVTRNVRLSMEMEADRAAEMRRRLLDIVDKAAENYKKAPTGEDVGAGNNKNLRYSYEVSVDEDLQNFIEKANEKRIGNWEQYVIEERIGKNLAEGIEAVLGFSVEGYRNVIRPDDIAHIEKRHGKRGKADHSMEDTADLARIKYVVENYDKIMSGNKSKKYVNSDGTKANNILIQKKIDDGFYYVVEAVPDTAKREMYVTSAYINKNDTFPQVNNAANGPVLYVRNELESNVSSSTNSIPQSAENSTGELKFSLSDTADLDEYWQEYDGFDDTIEKAASILEEGAAVMKEKEVDVDAVRKIARKMKQEYQSNIDIQTFTDNLVKVFSYLQTQDKVNYTDMLRVMNEVALPVVEESMDYEETAVQQYENFRQKLKSYKIKLNEQQKAEVANLYDSYDNFRKRFFGTLNLSEQGTYLDSIWSELVDASNGYLDTDANYAEEPLALVDALEAMKPQLRNNFGADNHGMAMDLSLRIYEEYFKDLYDTKAKLVEKQMRKERVEFREKVRKEYYEKLKQEKERMKKRTGTIAQRVAEVRAANTRSQLEKVRKEKAAEYRTNIKRTGGELIKWIERPTNQKHVPEALKKTTLEFLSAIDFISHRALDNSDSTIRWQERMRTVQGQLQAAEQNEMSDEYGNFILDLDPDFVPSLKEFIDRNNRVEKISQMDYDQLERLNELMNTLKRTISKANELHANKQYKHVSDVANRTIQELQSKKDRKSHSKPVEMVSNLLNLDMLDSLSYFETLGEGAKSVQKELREGFNARTWHIKEAQDYMKEVLKGKDIKTWTGDKAKVHEFLNGSGSIRLSTGQIMSLYLLGKRNQAKQHMMIGGIRAADVGEGRNRIQQVKPKHISEDLYKRMIGVLSTEQKEVADKLQKFLAKDCAEWGNHTSMELYGYRKFLDENYFPIKTYDNTRQTNDKNTIETASLYAIRNQGMTKNLDPNARNALVVEDIMDVFVNHVVGMANYDAFAVPLTDAMKWYNYKNQGMDGEFLQADTVKEEIERVYGKKAKNYFVTFIRAINGEVSQDTATRISDRFVSNYKAAAVGNNIRVAIQQFTAYMRAAMELNPIDLIRGMVGKPSIKKAKENSAIALWKSWGYFEMNLGQSMKQVITGQSTLKEKVQDKASFLAGLGDEITWGYLWNACESEVKRKNKGIDVNSKEFLQKVAERFDDVIDKTQVVDTVFHRTQIMRSNKDYHKLETAFMSEPHKSYNMLYRAGKNGKKALAKAAMVYIATGVLTSMAAALPDAFRDEDKKKKFGQRWVENFKANLVDNLNPLNMIPYVKDVFSFLSGFRAERLDMAGLYNMVNSTKQGVDFLQKRIVAVIDGETYEPKAGEKTAYGVAKSMLRSVSQVTGIPVYNLLRDIESVIETTTGEDWDEKYASVSSLCEDLLYYAEKGDEERYEEIYDRILEQVEDEDELESKVRSEIKEQYKDGAISREEAEDLLEEYGDGPDDIYWALDRIDSGEGSAYSKYNDFDEALESGKGLSSAIAELKEHGVKESTLASRITTLYKDTYIDLYKTNRREAAALKQKLLAAYVELGYKRSQKSKDIDAWLKEKKEE